MVCKYLIDSGYLTEEEVDAHVKVREMIRYIENCEVDVEISDVLSKLYELKYRIEQEIGRKIAECFQG